MAEKKAELSKLNLETEDAFKELEAAKEVRTDETYFKTMPVIRGGLRESNCNTQRKLQIGLKRRSNVLLEEVHRNQHASVYPKMIHWCYPLLSFSVRK